MEPPEQDEQPLAARLRQAATEEILALLASHAEELDAPAVRQALRNPFATREVVERISEVPRLLQSYEVRKALTFHPATPEVLAMKLVPGLYWRDLAELSLDIHSRPPLRVAAERALGERLPGLAEGEKMALARRVGAGLLARLRHDPSRRVIAALLENPRLTEGVLYPLVRQETTLPAVLALIAENPRWGSRYDLRVGLAGNPATPLQVALRLVPHLKRPDLKALAAGPRTAPAVRQRARLLLGEGS